MTHYIFVVGGVISGLGKGVISASLASLLNHKRVTIKKVDPYFNISAGNLNPVEHGEVFVTADGCETDLDLGHYERIGGIQTSSLNTTSSGKLMKEFLDNQQITGETIQLIPHFSNHIMEFFRQSAENYDYVIIEIGGSVSDIESQIYFESIRQFRKQEQTTVIFTSYVLKHNGEYKTKPTQNAVRKLRELGIQPDMIMCRVEDDTYPLPEPVIRKIELFTDVQHILTIPTLPTIYHVPSIIYWQLRDVIDVRRDVSDWRKLENKIGLTKSHKRIGIVGKYHASPDSYYSIKEALRHAGWTRGFDLELISIETPNKELIASCDGIVIPGGFGERSVNDIIRIIRICRTQNKPTLGICFGMQLMFLEYCRNVLKLRGATSQEFSNNPHEVISAVEEDMGMRVGEKSVGDKTFRVRHRYGVKSDRVHHTMEYVADSTNIVYELNWKNSTFYRGVQYHPEYSSTPFKPHPLFTDFLHQVNISNESYECNMC